MVTCKWTEYGIGIYQALLSMFFQDQCAKSSTCAPGISRLLFGAIKIYVRHMPVTSTLELQYVFCLTGADFVVIKHKPVFIVFIGVGNFLNLSRISRCLDPSHVMASICIPTFVRHNAKQLVMSLEVGRQTRSDRGRLIVVALNTHGKRSLEGSSFFVIFDVFCFHVGVVFLFRFALELSLDALFLFLQCLIPRFLQFFLHVIRTELVYVENAVESNWFHDLALDTRMVLRIRSCLPVKSTKLNRQNGRKSCNALLSSPSCITAKHFRALLDRTIQRQANPFSQVTNIRLS
mmetsp:Transcript_1744/g.2692  ORF Transcript_1744/g.2692 Transcript_1744/m.2692 type:complete len:291 (+) Transcript_1744:96-968(+)